MKQIIPVFIVLFFLSAKLFPQEVPAKAQVLSKMKLANEYFMNKWPDPAKELVNDNVRPSNIWTRATYYEGLMALYKVANEPKYLDYTLAWANFHQWNLAYGKFSRNADNLCCGQTYLDLYKMNPDPGRINKIREAADSLTASGILNDWCWIDALQMAMPVFARLGTITGEQKYWDRMFEMYLFTKNKQGGGLYNPKDGLWWRDSIYVPPYKEPNGEDCYWSRGNGWVLAAMARTLEQNPPVKKQKKEYLDMFKSMAEALSKIQREDGFWNVSLHDPNNFGGPETSGTAFFVYGLAWGINHRYLDKKKYLPIVLKGWNAISEKALHPDGFLGFVQGTGKEPASSQPTGYDVVPNFEDFGLGAFLLAGSEVYKMAK
jgi:unsaturated rhamnogalacturonyl hydrolase